MRRGTIVVLFFILIVGGIIAAGLLLPEPAPPEPIIANLVANSLVQDWLDNAAISFNNANIMIEGRPALVNIIYTDDLAIWRSTTWSTSNFPHGWLPALTASVGYASSVYTSLTLETVQPSTIQTLLVWGGYRERTNLLAAFNWQAVADAAQLGTWRAVSSNTSLGEFDRVNIAFSPPDSRTTGLGVLFSGAATLSGTADLTTASVSILDPLLPVVCRVPNFNAVGEDPAARMATNRSLADLALLPEKQWLTSLTRLGGGAVIELTYPQQTLLFDFPLVAVAVRNATPMPETEVVRLFGEYLLAEGQQRSAIAVGLRPVAGLPLVGGGLDVTASLFVDAQEAGLLVSPNLSAPIQPPDRTQALSFLNWFERRTCR